MSLLTSWGTWDATEASLGPTSGAAANTPSAPITTTT
jgi:hypothetical protein